jgi:hypothetical protein
MSIRLTLRKSGVAPKGTETLMFLRAIPSKETFSFAYHHLVTPKFSCS